MFHNLVGIKIRCVSFMSCYQFLPMVCCIPHWAHSGNLSLIHLTQSNSQCFMVQWCVRCCSTSQPNFVGMKIRCVRVMVGIQFLPMVCCILHRARTGNPSLTHLTQSNSASFMVHWCLRCFPTTQPNLVGMKMRCVSFMVCFQFLPMVCCIPHGAHTGNLSLTHLTQSNSQCFLVHWCMRCVPTSQTQPCGHHLQFCEFHGVFQVLPMVCCILHGAHTGNLSHSPHSVKQSIFHGKLGCEALFYNIAQPCGHKNQVCDFHGVFSISANGVLHTAWGSH
jgi:hypothetical protein